MYFCGLLKAVTRNKIPMGQQAHKAGFVSIVGKPNVGKSTLLNALVGEKLSIITSKAQTTRHRILGILSGQDFQVVYSDTPGIIKPNYELQEAMMRYVNTSLEDADVLLYVVDLEDKFNDDEVIRRIQQAQVPIILVLNKIDKARGSQVHDKLAYWKEQINPTTLVAVSALEKTNVEGLFAQILELLPEHPPYFDKEQLTDRPERFFAAEFVREQLFEHYRQEVPYSCQAVVTEFVEDERIIRMRAEIYVERKSQKGIIIGHKGESIKKVGIGARKQMEAFFGKQVHIELFVKVEPDWRSKMQKVRYFGYDH